LHSTKTPKISLADQLDIYGINDELIENKLPFGLSRRIAENIFPEGFNIGPDRPLLTMIKAIVTDTHEDNPYSRMETWYWSGTDLRGWDAVEGYSSAHILQDGFRLALGLPQKFGTYIASEYPITEKALQYKGIYKGNNKITYQLKNGEDIKDMSGYVIGPIDTPFPVRQFRPNLGTSTAVIRGEEKINNNVREGTRISSSLGDVTKYELVPGNYIELMDKIDYAPFGGGGYGRDYKGIAGWFNKKLENIASFPYYERIYSSNTTNAPLPRSAQPNPLDVLLQNSVPSNH